MLIDRKFGLLAAKKADSKQVELPLSLVNFLNDKYVKKLCSQKKYLEGELQGWLYGMQPSMKTMNFECKYFVELTFEHNGLTFGKSIPTITIPVQIYYNCKKQEIVNPNRPLPPNFNGLNERAAAHHFIEEEKQGH